jgi:hypothetical protein
MLTGENGFNVDYFVGDPFLLLHTKPAWDSWLGANETFFQKTAVDQKVSGMNVRTFQTTINPKAIVLPEGEVVVDFLVGNSGSAGVTLDGVFLDVVSRVNLPPSIAGEFLPMFKIYKDQAVIRQGENTYPMLNDQVLNYDPGQKDIYRFSVRVADSEGPGLFSCRLRITNIINGHRVETTSEPFWVAKYFGGQTNRNVYSKFHTDDAPITTLAYGLRHVDGLNSVSRPPRYTTHSLLAQVFQRGSRQFDIPGIRPDKTDDGMFSDAARPAQTPASPLPWSDGGTYAYALSHLNSVMAGKVRTKVQKYGFTLNGAIAPLAAMENFDLHMYGFGQSKDYDSYTMDLSEKGAAKREIEVYIGNSTRDYTALQLSVGETAIQGIGDQLYSLSDALVRLSRKDIDVAAKVDLTTLLAEVITPASLDRLVDFLRDNNPVVQHAAAKALRDYRWPNATERLWTLTNSPTSYVRDAATSALIMSATNREAELLKQEIVDANTKDEELDRLCRLFVQVSPAMAEALLKAHDTRKEVRSALIALTAN